MSVLLFMEYFICGAADHRDSQSAAKDADLAWRPEVSYNAVSVMEQYPQVTGVMCGEGEETF